jgi:uncharacterized protein (DUF608 family)
MSVRTFTGAALSQIAFPLGGIGTGTVSLGGRGNFRDWEIFNKPAKGYNLDRTFVAVRIAPEGEDAKARVVEREYLPPFGEALGFQNQRFAGLPRFREAVFTGAYPCAEIAFEDRAFPAEVTLEAFNPFVPMNVKDSSIPGMILGYRVKNTSGKRAAVALLAAMQNPIGIVRPGGWMGPGVNDPMFAPPPDREETLNEYREGDGLRGLYFTAPPAPAATLYAGSAAITTPWAATDVQTNFYRSFWWDGLHMLWDEFTEHGRLAEKIEARFGEKRPPTETKRRWEAGALCLRAELAPDEEVVFPLYVHWHFANAKLWNSETGVPVRTHVANDFTDAWDAAAYTHRERARLEAQTGAWRRVFYGSSLPDEVKDAAGSQVSIMRTQTVQRLSDGAIYAWEGCQDTEGSCSGNCTHVWNYEQALAFLFPSLERTMRRIDFGPNMHPDGMMTFRCEAPAGSAATTGFHLYPCVDGQMGNVIQAYRDWQLSGDDGFLRDIWPNVKAAVRHAWVGPDLWDPHKRGLIDGRQHNTYDIEFYGPNAMLSGLYLAALKAAAEMARHLADDDAAEEFARVYARGRERFESELWNGAYFVQKVEVADGLSVPRHLQTPGDPTFPKYQYGAGCLSDQLIGQWQAHVSGLGDVIDPAKAKSALTAIHRHNFRAELRSVESVQRVFGFQDEAGLILCSWPNGGRPKIPFVYSEEVWTGIEYQVAAHMIYAGLVDEGLQIVRAVRARYDGVRRNPWDEIECGHHYARAMASWSLVQAFSGAHYSAVEQALTFAPKVAGAFHCFVACGTAWGELRVDGSTAVFEVMYGDVTLRTFGPEDEAKTIAPRRLRAGDTISVSLHGASG